MAEPTRRARRFKPVGGGRALRVLMAACSAIVGVVVGGLINLLTARWSVAVAAGLVVAVACQVGLEAWRVLREPPRPGDVVVRQWVRDVFGGLLGARGAGNRPMDVRQNLDTVWPGGEATGYESGMSKGAAGED